MKGFSSTEVHLYVNFLFRCVFLRCLITIFSKCHFQAGIVYPMKYKYIFKNLQMTSLPRELLFCKSIK